MTEKDARARAAKLVASMTLEERVSQIQFDAPAIKRLRAPACHWRNEIFRGSELSGNATVFPQPIGLGAAFDPRLLRQIGECVATEGRARYNAAVRFGERDVGLTFQGPSVNILSDPRRDQGQETFGEDPYLTSRLAVELVKGLQGDGPTMKAAACPGRFPAGTGGLDAVSQKDLAETVLPPFETLVREGRVAAFAGDPALQRILREKWGFEGCFLTDPVAPDGESAGEEGVEAVALALNAGCDLGCGTVNQIMSALERGLVSEKRIEEAVVRLFTLRYRLGLFGKTGFDNIPYAEVESPEHLELARKAALESAVLLKNDGVLPLERDKLKTLGIIGPCADSREALCGGDPGSAYRHITVQEGLQDYLFGSGVRIVTSSGGSLAGAAAVAEMSDAAILVLGFAGDGDAPELPPEQRELMEIVAKAGKPTALVLLAGGGVELSRAQKLCGAILHVWRPGAMGGRAVAELLFGEESPSGKLPVTFYRSGGLPALEEGSVEGRTYRYVKSPVQFPFGFGLTYGNIIIRSFRLKGDGERGRYLEADIGNRGPRSTGEVLQVYARRLDSPFSPPHPALCAFRRVWLPVWGHTTVEIPIPDAAFTVVDGEGNRVRGGRFELFLGLSQPDKFSCRLTGKEPVRIEVEV